MQELFKKIDKLLQEAKDREFQFTYTDAGTFERGQIAALTEIGNLVRESIAQSNETIEKIYVCPYCKLEYTKPEGAKTCCVNRSRF